MKKAVFAVVFSAFILSSCFIETSVLAWGRDPELSSSQKQEISEVLGQLRSHKEELEECEKEAEDVRNGEEKYFNERIDNLQKEGEDILASPVGQRLGRKMSGWDKTDKTKPITDFLNEEETEALRRITTISNKIDKALESALERIYDRERGARHTVEIKEEELKKLEEKYGKAAIDALREGVEARESEVYTIDAYPINENLVGAKGQISISLDVVQGRAHVLINLKNRKVTSDNVMKIEYLTIKNNYPFSKFKKTDDKVSFTIDSVEYEHILYVKHSLIGLGMGSKNTLRKNWEKEPYHKNKKIDNLEGVINLSDNSVNGKCGKITFKGQATVQ